MSHRVLAFLALLPLLLSLGGGSAPAAEAPRFALVVGNAAGGAPTVKVHQSVNAVAEALRAAGYDVEARTDLDAAALRRAVREFAARVEAARGEAYAVLYLGGRVVQTDGRNFVLPRGADAANAGAVADKSVPVGEFLGALAAAPAKARLLIVDAAPGRDIDGIASGLAPIDPPRGTFVALVTGAESGAPAEEDFGAFSEAFAKALGEGNPDVEAVFEETAGVLSKATGGRQKIARAGALVDPFPLAAPAVTAKSEPPAPASTAKAEPAQPAPAPTAKAEPPAAAATAEPPVKQVRRVDLPPQQPEKPAAAPVPEVTPEKQASRSAGPNVPEPPARPAPPPVTAAAPPPAGATAPLPPRRPPPPRVAAVRPEAVEPPGFEPPGVGAPPPGVGAPPPGVGVPPPGVGAPPPGVGVPPQAPRAARPARPAVDEAYLASMRPRDAYNAVIVQDSPEAYRAFLRVYPNHRLAGNIRARLQGGSDIQAWRRAEAAGTPEAYIAYLQRFPYGSRRYEAAERLAQMGIGGGPPMVRMLPPGARYAPPPGYPPEAFDPFMQPF